MTAGGGDPTRTVGGAVTAGGGDPTRTAGGAVVAWQCATPFDAKLPWDAYQTQFEVLAGINWWGDTEKAAHLAIIPAATVLTNLTPEQRQSYAALTTALDARFGTAHQTELNRMRLKARTRRRDESLAELAEDVERLVRLAYPNASEPICMVEVLANDQFVDALPEEDMRLRIRQSKPSTLRDSLAVALELESYQIASKQEARYAREAHLEDGHYVQRQMSEPSGATDIVQQLIEALKNHTRPPDRYGT